jgi:hypothetical protein
MWGLYIFVYVRGMYYICSMEEMKVCNKCGEEKPISSMTTSKYKKKDGEISIYPRPFCKKCANKKTENRKKRNGKIKSRPSTHSSNRRDYTREYWLNKAYGITLQQYEDMVISQNNCCKICSKHASENKNGKLFVDHCHTKGNVRGLLCDDCNNLLGRAKDNVDILRSAIEYLLK